MIRRKFLSSVIALFGALVLPVKKMLGKEENPKQERDGVLRTFPISIIEEWTKKDPMFLYTMMAGCLPYTNTKALDGPVCWWHVSPNWKDDISAFIFVGKNSDWDTFVEKQKEFIMQRAEANDQRQLVKKIDDPRFDQKKVVMAKKHEENRQRRRREFEKEWLKKYGETAYVKRVKKLS